MPQQLFDLINAKLVPIVLILIAVGCYACKLPEAASGAILGAGLLAFKATSSQPPQA